MAALRNPKGTTTVLRRGIEKIIYDFYFDLFDNHVHFPPHNLRKSGHDMSSCRQGIVRHPVPTDKTRIPQELSASTHQHPGEALHTLSIGMQGSQTVEDQQDRVVV
ncbi:hypothetical protein RB195_022575 [Necator americanus]